MEQDLRVIKTRQSIQTHFFALLEKYSFRDITIKRLIRECQINRSTFYRNYEDKYALVEAIIDDLMKQFEQVIRPQFITLDTKSEETLIPYFLPLLNYFEKNKKTFLLMYNTSLPVNIFDSMLSVYSHCLLTELQQHYQILEAQTPLAAYFAQLIASNILTTIKWWHINSSEFTKTEILNLITNTIADGVCPSLQAQFLKKRRDWNA